jgi:GMP synthase PP-ATPase subunit
MVMAMFAEHLGVKVMRERRRPLLRRAGRRDPEAKRKIIGRLFVESSTPNRTS